MKKVIFLFVIGVLLASCGNKTNEYNVTGNIDGVNEGEAVLQKMELSSGPVPVDTAAITNGSFSFSGPVEYPQFYLIFVDDNEVPVPLFLESANIEISASVDSLQNAEVSGSELNDKFKKFDEEMPSMARSQVLQEELMRAQQDGDQQKIQELAAEYQSIAQERKQYFLDFVEANKDNVVGAFLAINLAQSMEPSKFEELISAFETNLKEGHPYVEEMKNLQESLQQQQQMPPQQQQRQPQQQQQQQPQQPETETQE